MKKPGWICCLLALLLVGAGCVAGCGDQPGTLKGTVTKASDATPLAGVEVRVFSLERVEGTSSDMLVFAQGHALQEHMTGEDGAYSFSLEPGDYTVSAWLEGEEVAGVRVEVTGRQTATVNLSVGTPSP